MSIKLEVIIPTSRDLTDEEKYEIEWAVYDAIQLKLLNPSYDHLHLKVEKAIVQKK